MVLTHPKRYPPGQTRTVIQQSLPIQRTTCQTPFSNQTGGNPTPPPSIKWRVKRKKKTSSSNGRSPSPPTLSTKRVALPPLFTAKNPSNSYKKTKFMKTSRSSSINSAPSDKPQNADIHPNQSNMPQSSANTENIRPVKTPPIILSSTDWRIAAPLVFQDQILNPDNISAKIIVQVTNPDDFRSIQRTLHQHNIAFITCSLPEECTLKVSFRGNPIDVSEEQRSQSTSQFAVLTLWQ